MMNKRNTVITLCAAAAIIIALIIIFASVADKDLADRTPTPEPTMIETTGPSVEPLDEVTPRPTAMATVKPTAKPTKKPTARPTVKPSASPAASKNVSVKLENFAFSPKTLNIPLNSTVIFTNKDDVDHTVTNVDGAFKSELFGLNETFTYKFTKAGTYIIYCEPHEFMKITIIVE